MSLLSVTKAQIFGDSELIIKAMKDEEVISDAKLSKYIDEVWNKIVNRKGFVIWTFLD